MFFCCIQHWKWCIHSWKLPWNLKSTQLKSGNSSEPNLHCWIQHVRFPEASFGWSMWNMEGSYIFSGFFRGKTDLFFTEGASNKLVEITSSTASLAVILRQILGILAILYALFWDGEFTWPFLERLSQVTFNWLGDKKGTAWITWIICLCFFWCTLVYPRSLLGSLLKSGISLWENARRCPRCLRKHLRWWHHDLRPAMGRHEPYQGLWSPRPDPLNMGVSKNSGENPQNGWWK